MKKVLIMMILVPLSGFSFELFCPVEEFPDSIDITDVKDAINCGQDLNIQDDFGNTALMRAAVEGHIDVVREFVRAEGVDLNVQNSNDDTALIKAVFYGHLEVVKELVRAEGIDLNAQSFVTKTALMQAVLRRRVEMVRELVRAEGIDLNVQDSDEHTALTFAALYGDLEVIKQLIHAANLSQHDSFYVHVAYSISSNEIVRSYLAQFL